MKDHGYTQNMSYCVKVTCEHFINILWKDFKDKTWYSAWNNTIFSIPRYYYARNLYEQYCWDRLKLHMLFRI